jgi:hypothetical protein
MAESGKAVMVMTRRRSRRSRKCLSQRGSIRAIVGSISLAFVSSCSPGSKKITTLRPATWCSVRAKIRTVSLFRRHRGLACLAEPAL